MTAPPPAAPSSAAPSTTTPAVRPVRDRAEVERRIAALGPRLRALGVERVRLFGSFVRGEQTDDSDVDLLVRVADSHLSFGTWCDVKDLAEAKLGRPVDLLTEGALGPRFGPHILAEADDVTLAA